MLKENEVIMLILGVGVMFLFILNRVHVKKIKSWKVLFAGYCILLFGWLCTVLEGLFLEHFLNLLEHMSYAVSAVLLIVWCWKYAQKVKEEEIL
jgi:hypothetical protein